MSFQQNTKYNFLKYASILYSLFSRPIFSWILALAVLFLCLHLGDFTQRFMRELRNSLTLIFPALFATVVIALALAVVKKAGQKFFMRWEKRLHDKYVQQQSIMWHVLRIFTSFSKSCLMTFISAVPTILSSIPLFITGIFFIRYYKLDTMYSHNFMYGILCIAAFNVNYFYKRSEQRIKQIYQRTSVLYARSLGLNEKTIFRYYVLPGAIRDHLVILRELLPHIIVESIVIEYTFSYNALMRSALQSLLYHDWYYFCIFIYVFVLLIMAFDMFCRWLESFFPIEA